MASKDKTIKVEQIGSALRRQHTQRETLVGLGLEQDRPHARPAGHADDARHDRKSEASRPRGGREIRRSGDEAERNRPEARLAEEALPHRPRHRLGRRQDRRARRQGPDRALRRAHQGLRRRPDADASPAAQARLPQHQVRAAAERGEPRQGAGGDRRQADRPVGGGGFRGAGQGRPDAAGQGRRAAPRQRRAQGQGEFRGVRRLQIGRGSRGEGRRLGQNPGTEA